MTEKNTVTKICTYIYDCKFNHAVELLNSEQQLVNHKCKKYDNKTPLMCALSVLEQADFPDEQQELLINLINIIAQNPNLHLKTTDDYGNTIFHLAFKYARNTDEPLSNILFNIGENFLQLIQDPEKLKTIVKKEDKTNLKKTQKLFLQYIFPDLTEETISEQEMINLRDIQQRVYFILLRIFPFPQKLAKILQDSIAKQTIRSPFILPKSGITLSWESWMQLIDNPSLANNATINNCNLAEILFKTKTKNKKIDKLKLKYHKIINQIIEIYTKNINNEEQLIASLDNHLTVNKTLIKNSPWHDNDIIIQQITKLMNSFKKYTQYIDSLTPNKLGIEYDINRH
jgi:hypothetical protein